MTPRGVNRPLSFFRREHGNALDENHHPFSKEAAKDVAVGFFFGAITSLLKSSNMTREASARMNETVEQMKRDYGTILADSGGSVTLDALDDLAAKSTEVRNTLRTTQFMGQQDTVNGVMQFLDTLDDTVARAKAGMGTGLTSWNGNMQGLRSGGGGLLGLPQGFNSGSNTSGMPILPGPAVVKDDWETALEEAVAEWKGSGAGSEADIDSSWEDAIMASTGDVFKRTPELEGHIQYVDPSTPRKRGIGGAHSIEEFFKNDVQIVKSIPGQDIPGVTYYQYNLPLLGKDGQPMGGYGITIFEKTVYDPSIFPFEEYMRRGLEAANDSYRTNKVLGDYWEGIDWCQMDWIWTRWQAHIVLPPCSQAIGKEKKDNE